MDLHQSILKRTGLSVTLIACVIALSPLRSREAQAGPIVNVVCTQTSASIIDCSVDPFLGYHMELTFPGILFDAVCHYWVTAWNDEFRTVEVSYDHDVSDPLDNCVGTGGYVVEDQDEDTVGGVAAFVDGSAFETTTHSDATFVVASAISASIIAVGLALGIGVVLLRSARARKRDQTSTSR